MVKKKAVKQGAQAIGKFGKAVANLAKKAGPAIATILNILAQVLTPGEQKHLSFCLGIFGLLHWLLPTSCTTR